jgi:hypothetical protein
MTATMLLPWAFGIICSKTGFTCSRFCASPGVTPIAIAVNASFTKTVRIYFLFIVRSRNSCINDPIRSTSSSNAKWPVSRRWSSALGISLLKSSAPSTVKIPSFFPQVISVGGCCLRKYSCHRHRHPDSFLRCRGLKVGFPCSPAGPDKPGRSPNCQG